MADFLWEVGGTSRCFSLVTNTGYSYKMDILNKIIICFKIDK